MWFTELGFEGLFLGPLLENTTQVKLEKVHAAIVNNYWMSSNLQVNLEKVYDARPCLDVQYLLHRFAFRFLYFSQSQPQNFQIFHPVSFKRKKEEDQRLKIILKLKAKAKTLKPTIILRTKLPC